MDKLRVFVSYAHEDVEYKKKLLKHCSLLVDNDILEMWTDDKIRAGHKFDEKIENEIKSCDIAILFFSTIYWTSDYIKKIEIPLILEEEKKRNIHIIPILINSLNKIKYTPLKNRSFIPLKNNFLTAIDDYLKKEDAWNYIFEEIEKVIEEKQNNKNLIPEWDTVKLGSPFPGLSSLTDKYHKVFFGRNNQIRTIMKKLKTFPFLFVIGSSGSGKSSLIWAGVIPLLIKGTIEESRDLYPAIRMTPGQADGNPIRALADALTRFPPSACYQSSSYAVEKILLSGIDKYPEIEVLIFQHRPYNAKLIIFIDQFEELFSIMNTNRILNELFIKWIECFLNSSKYIILFTMRTEFLSKCMSSSLFVPLHKWLEVGIFPLLPPNQLSLFEMIKKPAELANIYIEENLIEKIILDTGENTGGLPLMAFVLEKLLLMSDKNHITYSNYEKLGGIYGAINHQIEIAMLKILNLQKMKNIDTLNLAVLNIFSFLVDVDEITNTPVRKKVYLNQLPQDELSLCVLKELISTRLLVSDRLHIDLSNNNLATIEVSHEALFTTWPKLSEWIEEKKAYFILRKKLKSDAFEWNLQGKPITHKWSNERVIEAGKMINKLNYSPTSIEQEFLGPITFNEMLIAIKQEETSHQDRAIIGERLALIGDERQGVGVVDELPDICWCPIEKGITKIKTDKTEIKIKINAFNISKYPITQVQYSLFIEDEDGYFSSLWWENLPKRKDTEPGRQLHNFNNHPIVNVDWMEAIAYCRWLSNKLNKKIRLPTEAEWQLAATNGDLSNEFPWGENWNPSMANTYDSNLNRTIAVGMYAQCNFNENIPLDLCGNVWEWCLDEFSQPVDIDKIHLNNLNDRVRKGGSWDDDVKLSKSISRYFRHPQMRYSDIGFRVILEE